MTIHAAPDISELDAQQSRRLGFVMVFEVFSLVLFFVSLAGCRFLQNDVVFCFWCFMVYFGVFECWFIGYSSCDGVFSRLCYFFDAFSLLTGLSRLA